MASCARCGEKLRVDVIGPNDTHIACRKCGAKVPVASLQDWTDDVSATQLVDRDSIDELLGSAVDNDPLDPFDDYDDNTVPSHPVGDDIPYDDYAETSDDDFFTGIFRMGGTQVEEVSLSDPVAAPPPEPEPPSGFFAWLRGLFGRP